MTGIAAKVVASLLDKYLQLDRKSLKVSLGKGDVHLSNVRLRPDVFEPMGGNGAFRLQYGSVDSIDLRIPWRNIGKEATLVNVKGVVLVIVTDDVLVARKTVLDDTDVATRLKTALAETLDPKSLVAQVSVRVSTTVSHEVCVRACAHLVDHKDNCQHANSH
jgi:hypothetical protein